jgi:hypothetical protein
VVSIELDPPVSKGSYPTVESHLLLPSKQLFNPSQRNPAPQELHVRSLPEPRIAAVGARPANEDVAGAPTVSSDNRATARKPCFALWRSLIRS